jgi:hypothetical protein
MLSSSVNVCDAVISSVRSIKVITLSILPEGRVSANNPAFRNSQGSVEGCPVRKIRKNSAHGHLSRHRRRHELYAIHHKAVGSDRSGGAFTPARMTSLATCWPAQYSQHRSQNRIFCMHDHTPSSCSSYARVYSIVCFRTNIQYFLSLMYQY